MESVLIGYQKKAMALLKAKLLVIAQEQRAAEIARSHRFHP